MELVKRKQSTAEGDPSAQMIGDTRSRVMSSLSPDIDLSASKWMDHAIPLVFVACFSYVGVWARVLCGTTQGATMLCRMRTRR